MRIADFVEHPVLSDKALEAALFRTFAIPSISRILHNSGQFEHACRKRVDDTELLVREFNESHFDSDRSESVMRKIAHSHQSTCLHSQRQPGAATTQRHSLGVPDHKRRLPLRAEPVLPPTLSVRML